MRTGCPWVFRGRDTSAYSEIQRPVAGPACDKAFREGVQKAKPHFRLCPKCSKWVCQTTCWNAQRSLCYDCAPDVQTELASAQVHATVDQLRAKVQQTDMTQGIDVAAEAVARCPECGALTQSAKFCPECGKPLRPKDACAKCGAKMQAGTKFCPECGQKTS